MAEAADRLGYHHMTCSEHVTVPASVEDRRGARYWDPLATFGYLSARTERIRFATRAGARLPPPLAIAKRYGTLDRVTGGRLILGFGVGSLEEEFDLLGAPFDGRGASRRRPPRPPGVARRTSPACRRTTTTRGSSSTPTRAGAHPSGWEAGRTGRCGAVELADGWAPFGVPAEQLGEWIGWERATQRGRSGPTRWSSCSTRSIRRPHRRSRSDPDASVATSTRTTILNLRFRSDSLAECVASWRRWWARRQVRPSRGGIS